MSDAATPEELKRRALALVHPSPPEIPEPPKLGDWPTMSDDAYHGLAGEIVHAFDGYSEADPVALLLSTLVAFGCAVGPNPGMTADGAHHPARIFACLVGASSKARKGTSWRNIRNVFSIADPEWTHKRVKSGLSSGEGLINAVADPEIGPSGEEVPSTGSDDKRLLAIEEEFARVLQVSRREASTLSAIVRQAYDTGDLSVLTKRPMTATGAHISMLGHITGAELRARLTDTDVANGFANRYLFAMVRRGPLLPEAPQIPSTEINRLGVAVQHALRHARNVRQMRRDREANRLWEVMYERMAGDEPPGLLGALVARPEAHTLRLSIVYALLDGSDQVTVEHLRAAWAVWCFSRQSAELIFDEVDGNAAVRKLYQALKDAGPAGMSLTDQRDLFNRNLNGQRLEEMRLALEAANRIVTRAVPQPNGGRPEQRTWVIEHDPGLPLSMTERPKGVLS